MPRSCFDTNVLVYLASSDHGRADQAERVIANGGTISVQVLNELTNVARRKMLLSWKDTHDFLSLELAERYPLSTYDAMIAASARHAGCDTLWSEDLLDGAVLGGGLHIKNPFRHHADTDAAHPSSLET
jgi:predicted nucleic acid-binding protein